MEIKKELFEKLLYHAKNLRDSYNESYDDYMNDKYDYVTWSDHNCDIEAAISSFNDFLEENNL